MSNLLSRVFALASATPDPHLLPTAVCDDLRVARAKREVERARARLREAQTLAAAALRTLDEAVRHEERVEALTATDKVGAALNVLETAWSNRRNLRAGLLAAGQDIPAAADADLAAQERAAESALAEARMDVESAEAALPEVRAHLREAQEAVKAAKFDLDHAAWSVVLANVALETIDIFELALRLTEGYRALAAASQVAQRSQRLLGNQLPAPPMEQIPRVEWQFGDDDLRDGMRDLQDQFRRLLVDPEAQL
jgi:hypothetical protein